MTENTKTNSAGRLWWWVVAGVVGVGATVAGLVLTIQNADLTLSGPVTCNSMAAADQRIHEVSPNLHLPLPSVCSDVSTRHTIGIALLIFGIVVLVAGAVFFFWPWLSSMGSKSRSHLARTPMKTCPACAEKVKAEAKVCRYCGTKFDQPGNPASTGPSSLP